MFYYTPANEVEGGMLESVCRSFRLYIRPSLYLYETCSEHSLKPVKELISNLVCMQHAIRSAVTKSSNSFNEPFWSYCHLFPKDFCTSVYLNFVWTPKHKFSTDWDSHQTWYACRQSAVTTISNSMISHFGVIALCSPTQSEVMFACSITAQSRNGFISNLVCMVACNETECSEKISNNIIAIRSYCPLLNMLASGVIFLVPSVKLKYS